MHLAGLVVGRTKALEDFPGFIVWISPALAGNLVTGFYDCT